MPSLPSIVILLQLVLALLSNPATANNPTAQNLATQAIGYATQALEAQPTSTIGQSLSDPIVNLTSPVTIFFSNPQPETITLPTLAQALSLGSSNNVMQAPSEPTSTQVASPQVLDPSWRFGWIVYNPDTINGGYQIEFTAGGKSTGGKMANGQPSPTVTATLDGNPPAISPNQFYGVSAGAHQLVLTITSGNRYAVMTGMLNIVASSSDAQTQTTAVPVLTWQ